MKNNEIDPNLENNYKKSLLYIFLIIVVLLVGIIFLNKKNKYDDYKLKVESINDKYNSNEVKFSYIENDDIKNIIFYLDDKQLEIKNGDSFKINDIMDGSEHTIKINIYYSDGEEETYRLDYKIYSECDKNVKTIKKETSCNNKENTFSIKKKIIDEKTNKICSESIEKHQCSEKEIINKNDNNKDTNNNSINSNNDKDNNSDLNKNESNNTLEASNKENNISNSNDLNNTSGCNFVISKGVKGTNNWYISDVTIKLNISGENVLKYGITNSDKVDYNNKKEYVIAKDASSQKYYGFVKYKDGKTAECNITLNVDLVKPKCSVSMSESGSNTTLTVNGKDSESGVSKYSYNGSSFNNNNTYKITTGTKVNVRIQDNAGNIGSCTNYKDILILVGDSRTRHLQRDLGGKRVLSGTYNDIYYVESFDNDTKEVYAVAMSGASKNWLLGKSGESYDSGAYQVQELLTMLSKNNYYSDVIIATNLGVNDLHSFTPEKAFGVYTSAYENLLKSSQPVIVKSQTKSASWKISKNVIKINLYFISVNPIDEKLLNTYVPTNKRTLSSIISYNSLMKNYFGNKYIDSYSQFNNWFNTALKNGQNKYVIGDCYNSNNQVYKCEDGLHYSKYINTKLLYPFYKEKLFANLK